MGTPAVVVIDMQNDFLAPGAPIECAGGRAIVEPIGKLLSMARHRKVPVIFTQELHRAEMIDFGRELDYEEPVHCLEGSKGADYFGALRPLQGDFAVPKRRYSAFFATDLDILLKGLGVDTLILTGVATDVCVRATAQDAHQHDYRVIVIPECVAGTNAQRHAAALDNIAYVFGRVVGLETMVEELIGSAGRTGSGVPDRNVARAGHTH